MKKPRSATKTRPGRPAIPQSQWTHRNWLNHLADRYASLNHQATAYHEERKLRPGKIFCINVAVVLREVMCMESFYWLHDGALPPVTPAPPGPDSMEAPLPPDLRMPTAKPVNSLYSTNSDALDYLLQRNFEVSLRPLETRYYAPTNWARCNAVQLLRLVLNKLAGSRSSDLRFAYLCLVWD
jgi:hypothetical protein